MNKERVGGLLGGENNKWYCNFKIPRGYIWNNTVNIGHLRLGSHLNLVLFNFFPLLQSKE